jgi:hypothetical protein
MQPSEEYDIENMPEEVEPETDERDMWLSRARDAYRVAEDYFTASIRKQVEKNISLFQSRHPQGSKYYSDAYKYRSKIFRPKTRSTIRRHEAAAALAYFATNDTVSALPENPNDEQARIAAKIAKALINYRLEYSIPWFQTVIGAYQDAMVNGVVASRQTWKYKEKLREVEIEVEPGQVEVMATSEVIEDKPDIELIPPENLRFDPASDWRDPVKTSPYIIERIPMHLYKVRERMQQPDLKTGEAAWLDVDDDALTGANNSGQNDPTRQTREHSRQDSKDQDTPISDYTVVWVHRNIVAKDGEDWIYYTAGTEHLLSDPVPLEEVYHHGRPYVLGTANIETHKIYPAGLPEMGEGLQTEANDIANQRLDNIKLVLNRRYLARRQANVDWRSLTQSVPGGVTLVDDPMNDVKIDAPPDVTGSSYQEQDRISLDYDELTGSFSPGSVQTNRALNETVGGMSLLSQDSNTVTEYQLRVFTETWVEPVLRQLLDLERHYETDPVVLNIASAQMEPEQVIELLNSPISVRVAVGFGATSPHKRVEKLTMGLNTIGNFLPQAMQQIKTDEVISEVFGALGYRDGQRFFEMGEEQDPRLMQMAEQLRQMQAALESNQAEAQAKMHIEQQKLELEREKFQVKTQIDRELKIAELAQKEGLTIAQLQQKMEEIDRKSILEAQKMASQRDIEGVKAMNHQNELAFKARTGRQGI